MAKKLFVGGIPWATTSDDLQQLFSAHGTVSSATVITDKMSGRSKGFGFVEMEDDEAAKTAIANLNETEIQGRKLIVNESQPRPEGSGGGGGGFKKRSFGSGGGGGGYKKSGGYGGGAAAIRRADCEKFSSAVKIPFNDIAQSLDIIRLYALCIGIFYLKS